MIGYKRMERGSLFCERQCGQIVQQLKNNDSQHTIAESLGILSSTVYNVIE